MASLILLLCGLLRRENQDHLVSPFLCPSAVVSPPSTATGRAADKTSTFFLTERVIDAKDQFEEELPRICVDLVWP
ncbi:hypothetical protein CASFOL_029150 [Castilleja foliolosa]|uniref:Secreted protein n=1 Tax=Castilleja foliolosa TaxID=1961234 RepID=A0ABD3CE51_9LAMI